MASKWIIIYFYMGYIGVIAHLLSIYQFLWHIQVVLGEQELKALKPLAVVRNPEPPSRKRWRVSGGDEVMFWLVIYVAWTGG